MRNDCTLCVGTIGSGIGRSPNGGETWTRVRPSRSPENDVRALAVHPRAPHIVYAGTASGVYRSEDRGAHWERLDAPMHTLHTWALAIAPAEPETLCAGTQPSAVFRSQDGGQRWATLAMDLAAACPAVVIPRVTALVVDPEDHRTLWAGIEVDGVRRSLDGGETWVTIAGGLSDLDIHGIAISGGQPKTILATTPREVCASTDAGESWQGLEVMPPCPYAYSRALAVKADNPRVIFVGHGQTASPTSGAVQRSTDGGTTWDTLPRPTEPTSYIRCLATHLADPDLGRARSLYGPLLWSQDGGDAWQKVRQECSEVRALAWMPS